jgi:Calcineurin-like phosphoesterase
MKARHVLLVIACCVALFPAPHPKAGGANLSGPRRAVMSAAEASPAPDADWYFAVSGDSRDCGDIIMPKIARAIADRQNTPAQFYWHLGDFRAIYRIDCDFIKRSDPAFKCPASSQPSPSYIKSAWDDFIEHQVRPFGITPVFLGIGNHELIGFTRDQYREKFREWLEQDALERQRTKDAASGFIYQPGNSYYHFGKNGVDFLYLDNADDDGFSEEQLLWLSKTLDADATDDSVKTIIVGMHAALPHSKSSGHAMDKACKSLCSGERAYKILYDAQNLMGPPGKRKHVYVLASHSHRFLKDIYNTPQLKGRVLPGWIVGTAGAEQYTKTIRYGYLQVRVNPEGTIKPEFVDIKLKSPPEVTGKGAQEITSYCFVKNKSVSADQKATGCSCGTPP